MPVVSILLYQTFMLFIPHNNYGLLLHPIF